MKVKTILIVTAVLTSIYGIVFLFAPDLIPASHGVTADPGVKHMALFLGSGLLALSVLSWAARNTPDSTARRAIVLALFVYWTLGTIVATLWQLTGIPEASGWSIVVFHAPLAVIFGYFAIKYRGPIQE
jgi:ABC-type transport system involved in cytochrome c biogenesis permease subunit